MKNLSEGEMTTLISSLRACSQARKWASGRGLKESWEICDHGDWLLWLAEKMIGQEGWPTREQIVMAACDCAETALPFCSDKSRPVVKTCIEATRRWATGKATLEDVEKARAATCAASAAAAAAADAANTYVTYAAASAAADAAASAANTYVTYAAASAAADAAASDAAYAATANAAAARTKALSKCADLVRARLALSFDR